MGLKANGRLLLLFMALVTLYTSIITLMYDPSIGQGMNELAQSMPDLFAAFGMKDPGSTLLEFLINYLYGFILILIPFLFSVLLSYNLIARYIDKGSMAYLLNGNFGRKKIIGTQIIVYILEQFLLIGYATILVLLCSRFLVDGNIEVDRFLCLNIGLFCLHLFLGSICMVLACTFNEIRYSVGLGAGMGLVFLLIQMLSDVNDEYEFLNYLTPLRLFSPDQLIHYEMTGYLYILILFVVGVCLMLLAKTIFSKRDLPL